MDDIILTNIKTNSIETVKKKDAVTLLYYMKYRVPLDEELDSVNITREDIKAILSRISYIIPLFSEISTNLILTRKEDVFKRVTHESFRFPDVNEITRKYNDELEKKIVSGSEFRKIDTNSIQYKFYGDLYFNERIRKFKCMIFFLNQFNMDILSNTFLNIILEKTNIVGQNLTLCVRPSFTPYFYHLKPYYTKDELIKLALNMQLTESSTDKDIDNGMLLTLCKNVVDNDIPARIILDHNDYIIKSGKMGLVQHYTLTGSAEISRYLRNPYSMKNVYYEKHAKSLYNLIINSPPLDNNYTIYRFVGSDDYLKKYNIGDKYITLNPESYTRNPFFGKDKLGMFGNILIKLNIPKNIPGVCLSIETLSYYKSEEEILLCQGSALILKSKDINVKYYRPDELENNVITTRYEFDYYNSTAFKINGKRDLPKELMLIDFLELHREDKIKPITVDEKIKLFTYQYTNELKQFSTIIGNKQYTVCLSEYDSTLLSYSRFYAIKNSKGHLMSTLIDDNYGFVIEIGEVDSQICIHVNYMLRFTTVPPINWISKDDLTHFVSTLACYLECNHTYIHSEYMSCDYGHDHRNKLLLGGNYNVDFYGYFKTGKLAPKKYSDYLVPAFYVNKLEELKKIDSSTLFKEYQERDELYQLHKLLFIPIIGRHTIGEFYTWLVENWGIHVQTLVNKISYILPNNQNPFKRDYYSFDAHKYLYDNAYIDQYHGVELEYMYDISYSRINRFETSSIDRLRNDRNMYSRDSRSENPYY